MALAIKYTNEIVQNPRFLIYGGPGSGKTSLMATLAEDEDILFGATEGGLQTIAHLRLPYFDLNRAPAWEDMITYLRSGKKERDGLRIGNKFVRGVVIDLHGEYVQLALTDLCANNKAVRDGERSIDDTSEYDYKRLNLKVIRQMRELRKFPLKYVGLTCYEQTWRSKTGDVTSIGPEYVGTKIVNSVLGHMDYVFRIESPLNAKEALGCRIIRTQPTNIISAKARVPGVAGNIALPPTIKFPLGHTTLLPKIFSKVDAIISGHRKLEPTVPVPSEVEESPSEQEA